MNRKQLAVLSAAVFLAATVFAAPVRAQQPAATTVTAENAPAAPGAAAPAAGASVVIHRSEYALPYPGMLPDHPLYSLKRLRDAILERVIAEPVKRAEFFILQADKRLAMGMTLMEQQGKAVLAESTISKGEKYMERAVSALSGYKTSGNTVPAGLTERLGKSLAKHKEVLTDLSARANAAEKAGLSASLSLVTSLEAELAKLK